MDTVRFSGKGLHLLVTASFFFSLVAAGVKYAGARIPLYEIVFFRSVIGSAMIILAARLTGRRIIGREKIPLMVRGIFGFFAVSCFFLALTRLPLADAVLLSYTSPLFVAILSVIVFRERITARIVGFITVAFICIYVIMKPGMRILNPGGIAALGSGFFASLAFIWIKKLQKESPLSIIVYFSVITAVISGIIIIPRFVIPSPADLMAMIGIGIGATLAQLFLTIAIVVENVAAASALTCLNVIFSYVLGLIFWREQPDPASLIAGGILMISSIAFSYTSLSKKVSLPAD